MKFQEHHFSIHVQMILHRVRGVVVLVFHERVVNFFTFGRMLRCESVPDLIMVRLREK